jgi:hypothetical protein
VAQHLFQEDGTVTIQIHCIKQEICHMCDGGGGGTVTLGTYATAV